LTINNSGNCPLALSNILSTEADFIVPAVSNFPVVLQPGSSLPVTLTFMPQDVGDRSGQIVIDSNDPLTPVTTLPVSGMGLPPQQIATVIADDGYFGEVSPCKFVDEPLTINNTGNCNLIISQIDLSSNVVYLTNETANYTNIIAVSNWFLLPSVTNFPLVIAPGDSLEVPIRFAPPDLDTNASFVLDNLPTNSAEVSITSNDSNRPVATVPVSGALGPLQQIVVVAPDSGNFGSVPVCQFQDLVFTVQNSGGCNLVLSNIITISLEFLQPFITNFPVVIAPGDSLDVTIRYAPRLPAGPSSSVVFFDSNDPDNPTVSVNVSGTVLPGAGISAYIADSGNFGSIGVSCGFVDLPLSINNNGYCDLVITNLSADFPFIVPDPLVFPLLIAPGASLQVPIRFSPPYVDNFTGDVRIFPSNQPTTLVAVQGTGISGQSAATVIADSGYFGSATSYQFVDLPLTINNPGNCPLVISSIYTSGNYFCCSNPLTSSKSIALANAGGFFTEFYGIPPGVPFTVFGTAKGCSGIVSNVTAMTNVTCTNMIIGSITNTVCTTNVTYTTNYAAGPGACLTQFFIPPGTMSYPLVVAPGDSITVPIRFQPNTCCSNGMLPVGTNFGLVFVQSNDPKSPAVVPVSGVIAPPQGLAAALGDSGNFGDVPVGCGAATLPLTLNNTGASSLVVSNIVISDISIFGAASFVAPFVTNYPLVIAPGASIQLTVGFVPVVTGVITDAVSIISTDPTNPILDIPLIGNGLPGAVLATAIADSGNFGGVPANCGFVDLPLTLNNPGNCDVVISNVTSGNPAFLVPGVVVYPLVISPGSSMVLPLRFQPLEVGPVVSQFNIIASDQVTPHVVNVSGTGVPAGILATAIADSGNFGDVPVDCGFTDLLLTLNNPGNCDVLITNVFCSDPSFLVPSVIVYPLVINAGGSLVLPLRFQPLVVGPASSVFEIAATDQAAPHLVSVSGTGLPGASLAVVIVNDGAVSLLDTNLLTIDLNNNGYCDLYVSNITSTLAGFPSPIISNAPVAIAPGTSLYLNLPFQLFTSGTNSGTIIITFNNPSNSTVTFPLTIVGLPSSSQITFTGITLLPVTGSSNLFNYSFTVSNSSSFTFQSLTLIAPSQTLIVLPSSQFNFPSPLSPGSHYVVNVQLKALQPWTNTTIGVTLQTVKTTGTNITTIGPLTLALPSNVPTLLITAIDYLTNYVRLYFTSVSNYQYIVQERADLSKGSWTNIGSSVAGTGGTVSNVVPTSSASHEFYRISGSPPK
jgi:hypothetical protein